MAVESQDSIWPLPKFYFKVDLGYGTEVLFQEVSGLNVSEQAIEYRHGNNPVFSTINMPGIVKSPHVTLKKGIFVNANEFFDWYDRIKMNTLERRNVVIILCDEAGNPTMTWTLTNAWPTKITAIDMNSDANEVAVESIEFSYDGLSVSQ